MSRSLLFLLSLLFSLPTLAGAAAFAQGRAGAPSEGEQVLFLIDDSSSMTSSAFAPPDTAASRWDLVQKHIPAWLSRLNARTRVGAVSAGGQCGGPPSINLHVGAERSQLLDAMRATRPDGYTNLNSVLQNSPSLFDLGTEGSKRIVLLSDGMNTCPPGGSTCDIARSLHRDHGIVVDVVAWVTSPEMVKEFQCVTDVAGGTFTTPQSNEQWADIPLPGFDPWRYVVLVLNILTLLSASTILYRHAHRVLGWSTGMATLAASLLLGVGTLAAYVALFANAGVAALLLGAALAASVLLTAARRPRRAEATPGGPSPWAVSGFALMVLLSAPAAARANVAAASCGKLVQGAPRYHHVLAIDASGSVAGHIEQMKTLLSCYGEMYTLPGEEITLIAFGQDEFGAVKELSTFTVPEDGSMRILDQMLNDIRIQDARRTKTYFRPLADALTQSLQKVRLEPVVLIVSDGRSDGFSDTEKGNVAFAEVPFESFGSRGIYSAPGMNGWKVAVQGGSGIDLTALFQRPLATPAAVRQSARSASAVIDPCLLDPQLIVQTDDRLLLKPSLLPFGRTAEGVLDVRVKNACAARFRSFTVELRRGEKKYVLGRLDKVLIDSTPRTFPFKVTMPADGEESGESVLQVTLEQGSATRTIYPQSPSTIVVEQASYVQTYGLTLGVLAAVALLSALLAALVVRSARAKARQRPEVVKVLGGHGVPLLRHQPVSVGGDGCKLTVPGVAGRTTLATIEWAGVRGELRVTPAEGFRMKVGGVETSGTSVYRLGQTLQFTDLDGGVTHDVTLYGGTSRDIGFNSGAYTGGGSDDFAGAFPDLDDFTSKAAPVITPAQSHNGNGAGGGHYI